MSIISGTRTLKCFKCKGTANLITHHLSYFPEKTRPCCNSCHRKIHAKRSKISKEELQISIRASIKKTQGNNKPVDFDINVIRSDINNLFNY